MRWSTSGWRRQVPVAVHGASSRIASKRSSGSHVSASAVTIRAVSPARARLASSRSSRRADLSSAVTCQPTAASWSVLPPGAAHRSSAWRPSPAPINRTGRLAAKSWTHHAPSAKPASASIAVPRGRRTWPGASEVPPSRSHHCAVSLASRRLRSSGGGSASAAAMAPMRPGCVGSQRAATALGSVGCAGNCTSRRNSAENTPCASRLGPPLSSGKPVAITACAGVPRRSVWASISRNTLRGLTSSARRCAVALSISASRSPSQRKLSLAMASASARSSPLSPRDAAAPACSSVSPRRSTASSKRRAVARAGRPGISGGVIAVALEGAACDGN